jgi:AraC-like DNA-binding protein
MFFYLLTAMTRSSIGPELLPLVLDGQAQAASTIAMESLENASCANSGTVAMERATLAADLMLAQDCPEEAEDLYRQALTAAATAPRGQARVISCRNTAFLSLYQRRYSAAASSFGRIAEDNAATISQQIEALAGAALTQHALGRRDSASAAIDDASARLDSFSPVDQMKRNSLRQFLRFVRIELLVQYAIRTHVGLADHIFWQSDLVYASASMSVPDLVNELRQELTNAASHRLLTQRLDYLNALVQACTGQVRALTLTQKHLAWLRQMHLAAPERQCRMEGALAAIVARDARLARSLLEPMNSRQGESHHRWDFELSYCRAKLCEMTGQSDECLRHYQRYALECTMCLRSETHHAPLARTLNSRVGEAKDEIELALPAKYRRAYRYLITQINRADLTVREIADHVGVSERAVQFAFRSHVGMTPLEVLRRSRVEHIREDLLRTDSSGPTVIETAARWGIRSRSTLVASYRKHFQETPADTLARRSPPSPAPV